MPLSLRTYETYAFIIGTGNIINQLFVREGQIGRKFLWRDTDMLIDNLNELVKKSDLESTPMVLQPPIGVMLTARVVSDFIQIRNNRWSLSIKVVKDGANPREMIVALRPVITSSYGVAEERALLSKLPLVAEAVKKAILECADGINLRVRRETAQGLAELNAEMARKGVALPPELLGETFSYVQRYSQKPYPGHEERLASARETIAREREEARREALKARQEALTAQQMQLIQSLPLKDQEAAYAALGGRRIKRRVRRYSKRTNRSKRSH